ncbi:MAG TPA: hypothetical protein VGE74_01180 [Gemmata sp.]
MEKVVILDVGLEGGGATVYGRRDASGWVFWQDGSAMGDDPDEWRGWTTDPVRDLFAALPEQWFLMFPLDVHPDFKAPVRAEFERRVAQLTDEGMRRHAARLRAKWNALTA